jgi:hypothetical protein
MLKWIKWFKFNCSKELWVFQCVLVVFNSEKQTQFRLAPSTAGGLTQI